MNIRSASAFFVLSAVACSSGKGAPGAVSGADSANAKAPPCATDEGVATALYSGDLAAITTDGKDVFVAGAGLVRVTLADGSATTIATPEDPYNLMALNGVLYFTAERTTGVADAQGKVPSESVFESLPVSGGTPAEIPGITPGGLAQAADADSLYFDGIAVTSETTIIRLSPPDIQPTALALDSVILVDAIATHGDQVYVAGQDFRADSQTENGVIERIAKSGGQAERLVENIGHPWNLVADDGGIYWSEDPPDFGPSHIRRANLDGSSPKNLLEVSTASLALADGRLYFGSDDLESITTSGTDRKAIATDVEAPGMFLVVGGNLVWVDPATKALSDPTVPQLMTACLER